MTDYKLQATIGGYGTGPSVSVYALFSQGHIIVARATSAPESQPRADGIDAYACSTRGAIADITLTTERLQDGVAAYMRMRERILFDDSVQHANPANVIHAEKITEGGMHYRFSDIDSIRNNQVAVLAIAMLAESMENGAVMLEMADAFAAPMQSLLGVRTYA